MRAKVECPECGKIVKALGLAAHKRMVHTPNPPRPWEARIGIPSHNKGKKYEDYLSPEAVAIVKSKARERCETDPIMLKVSPDRRSEQRSSEMKRRYAAGWQSHAGRCKKYKYQSKVAGTVSLDGTWEVKVAIHLDKLGVIWERNKKGFSYTHLDGNTALYFPDFYVKDWDSYLEVKGYETDLDRCKWAQFEPKLLVWKEKELRDLGLL